MTRRIFPTSTPKTLPVLVALLAALLFAPAARADEDDDLQRQIDTQKSGVTDLERLDANRAAAGEIQRLKDWLAQAWELRSKHEPDEARAVLDRCLVQAELIRQVITAAQLRAEVADKEDKLKRTRAEIDQKRRALQDAQVKRKSLEPSLGQ